MSSTASPPPRPSGLTIRLPAKPASSSAAGPSAKAGPSNSTVIDVDAYEEETVPGPSARKDKGKGKAKPTKIKQEKPAPSEAEVEGPEPRAHLLEWRSEKVCRLRAVPSQATDVPLPV